LSIINDVVPILVNPAAGGGKAFRAARSAAMLLQHHGVPAEVLRATGTGDLERQARSLAESGAERVLVCGGDGTVHEAVNGLAGTATVLGVVPAGRGNDFAAAIGVAGGAAAAVELFLKGRARRVDVGSVNGRRFGTVLALGLDADVALQTRTGWWRHAGRPGYVACAMLRLFTFRAPVFTITGDFGRREGAYLLCAVSNTGTYGGGVPIAPDSSVEDGQFDLCLVRDVPVKRALRLIPRILEGRHGGLDEVELLRTTSLEICSQHSVPAVADGEPVGATPVRVSIEPASLWVMARPI
jgi:diacylglycerol kinase (ATP)